MVVTAATTTPAPDDADLVDRWRAGDEAAAAELMARHARPVARYLAAAGGGDDVEDLVQEAFFRAFRHIARFRGGASFRTWVITIARNALTDLRRRRRQRPAVPLGDHDLPDPAADPHREAVARDTIARLESAVRRLPPMQRDVFLLRAQQGMDYPEIARVLETSPGAARVHYHHAVRRLRGVLDDTPRP